MTVETAPIPAFADAQPTVSTEPATAADVRAWAKEFGRTDVAARGRIAADVKTAFTAATGRQVA